MNKVFKGMRKLHPLRLVSHKDANKKSFIAIVSQDDAPKPQDLPEKDGMELWRITGTGYKDTAIKELSNYAVDSTKVADTKEENVTTYEIHVKDASVVVAILSAGVTVVGILVSGAFLGILAYIAYCIYKTLVG